MRILHVFGNADIGGIASVVYNYMCHLDQDRYHIDVALVGGRTGVFSQKMIDLGATIYQLPLKSVDLEGFQNQLATILDAGDYDAIHVHDNETSWVALRVAKRMGLKCRVAHMHSATKPSGKNAFARFFSGRILNYVYATNLIACGKDVAECAYGKMQMHSHKLTMLTNGIDTTKYRFDPIARNEIREELGLGSRYTIGMVGRVSGVKNPGFTLQVVRELVSRDIDCALVLVGNGELVNPIQARCKILGIENRVLFTGARADVERIYPALDICIMPSLYEGLPLVALEALSSGLPVALSEAVTRELADAGDVAYLPLEVDAWVDYLSTMPIGHNRGQAHLRVRQSGFDISHNAAVLARLYDSKGLAIGNRSACSC